MENAAGIHSPAASLELGDEGNRAVGARTLPLSREQEVLEPCVERGDGKSEEIQHREVRVPVLPRGKHL